jgi:hypothetical protein
MPRGYRCILVAFIGWLSLAAINPQQGSGKPTAATDQNISSAADNITATPQQADEPKGYKDPCRTGDDNRNSDLCAQWKAADAAKSAAQAAWWLGGLGTVIGALTLAAAWAAAMYAKEAAKHTKAGADEARRAANAAEKGLRHSEKVTRAELRAYLAAEKEKLRLDGNEASIDVFLRNVGQTPAEEVSSQRRLYFIAGRKNPKVFPGMSYSTSMGTVGPKVPIEAYTPMHLSPGKLRALRAGIARFELRMSVTFVDMFGDRWRYEQHIFSDNRSVETGVVYTTRCQTAPFKETAQGELPLKGKKNRKKRT